MTRRWTKGRAEAALRFWQKILRLEDWDIAIHYKRTADLGREVFAMTVMHCREKRQADILLLAPQDVATIRFRAGDTWDWEASIVHELLHILQDDAIGSLERLRQSHPLRVAEERQVNVLAIALVRLNRARHNKGRIPNGHVIG